MCVGFMWTETARGVVKVHARGGVLVSKNCIPSLIPYGNVHNLDTHKFNEFVMRNYFIIFV